MPKNYFLWIVYSAIFCLILIFISLLRQVNTPVTDKPQIPPPTTPYQSSISGVGIVEPSTDNIKIGSPVSRIVESVKVKVGEKVKKGDILFTLDDRDLQAELKVKLASYHSSLAKLKKLEAYPQHEDLTAATSALESAKAELDLANNQYKMILDLPDPRAISLQEKNRRLYNFQQAESKLETAQANLDKIQKGAWKPDVNIAHQAVDEAKAAVNQIQTELERTVIRSPIDGTVLQITIHQGELASAEVGNPLMIVGNTDDLFLRVSINQIEIPFFHSDEPAIAYPQGDASIKYPLVFDHVEPLLTQKKNVTHGITETVDTRVLQIIYRINKDEHHPLYVGQPMDVFIETKEPKRA